MSRNKSLATVSVEQAAELLGFDAQTLRLCLQTNDWPEIGGTARKAGSDRECYIYEISKFLLFSHLGYDVSLSVEEVLLRVRTGNPPWVDQSRIIAHTLLLGQKKKDVTQADQSQ